MDRRTFLGALPAAALLAGCAATQAQGTQAAVTSALSAAAGLKGVLMMNRIAPSISRLMIAAADGSNARPFLSEGAFDYNPAFSPDGRLVSFTSERNGDGQSDLFIANADGTGIRQILATPAMEDAGVISPDGSKLAYVSTAEGYRANVWVMDLSTGQSRRLTGSGTDAVKGEGPLMPDGYFRPAWSPDGQWIAFTSDRDTYWRGHDGERGWEHTQSLGIYLIRPDGTDMRLVTKKVDTVMGSPKWSPDGKRLVFYEMDVEATWGARRPNYIGKAYSQIVSIELATGERTVHTTGTDLKLQPQFITNDEIGYLIKYGENEGFAYTSDRPAFRKVGVRSPCWSADGSTVVYEEVAFQPVRPLNKPIYGWDREWEYQHIDVFPQLGRDGWVVFTEKQLGNSSIVMMRPDGSGKQTVFQSENRGLDTRRVRMGLAGAFQPAWSPDGEWITFGFGYWFTQRDQETAALWRVRRDGTAAEQLTDGSIHSGFPSYSADGKEIVFRVWSATEKGLRILNLETRQIRVLTEGYDNLPGWSPDGQRIVFTRKDAEGNFDIYTIRPDGTGLYRCTDHPSSDGHAVWSHDGRILWSGSMHGFRDEASLYEQTFQQYGQIYIMNADGSDRRMLTDSKWEDSMPLLIPYSMLGR